MKGRHIRLIPIIGRPASRSRKGMMSTRKGFRTAISARGKTAAISLQQCGRVILHFPDVLNPDARKWFGDKYRFLTDQGIEGFWNDMNEPAIFYSKEGLDEAKELARRFADGEDGRWGRRRQRGGYGRWGINCGALPTAGGLPEILSQYRRKESAS